MSIVLNILEDIVEQHKIFSTIKTSGGGVRSGDNKAMCPYCHKVMQNQIAHRWHMNNCKMKGK